MITAKEIADWLNQIENSLASDAVPVEVTIGTEVFQGARYAGSFRDPELMYYLLGDLPKSYQRRKHTCYRFPEDDRDWFIAGHMQRPDALTPEQRKYHPHGKFFQLGVWTLDRAIDLGARYAYKRVDAKVKFL